MSLMTSSTDRQSQFPRPDPFRTGVSKVTVVTVKPLSRLESKSRNYMDLTQSYSGLCRAGGSAGTVLAMKA